MRIASMLGVLTFIPSVFINRKGNTKQRDSGKRSEG